MKEKEEDCLIDSAYKTIVSCPDCGNQNVLYLVRRSELLEGLQNLWCDQCNKPYVVDVKCELKAKIKVWGCKP